MKKYKIGGTKDCKKQSCPETHYWRQDLCRCVKHLSADSVKNPPSKNDLMVKKEIKKAKEAVGTLQKNASNNLKKVKNLFGLKKGGTVKSKKKK
jgi:hypothetical protein